MMILVSGAKGLVGASLTPYLRAQGHQVKTLVRQSPSESSQIYWNPPEKGPDPATLEGVDAVVHLAGDGIASGRWTEAKKKSIRDSRVLGTRLLSEAFARMKKPPQALISASAIGYYGDRGEESLSENSPAGSGFLPDVCKAWEEASRGRSKIRIVNLRFGIILSASGGALAKMLFPFKLGAGGVMGSGKQYMSWIALDDVVGVMAHALLSPSIQGPVNTVAPEPVTNAEFTKTLGRVLGRPTVLPMPALAARLVFGEMADALLLASARVEPTVLNRSGYHFQWPHLEQTLRHLLKK